MKKNNRGFTLVELVIVVGIIGILAGVAYPAYTKYVTKAKCTDAMKSLLMLEARMIEFYDIADTYVGATINAAGTGTVGSNQSPEGLYTLWIMEQSAFTYTLAAIPNDTGQKTLILDSLGQKTETGAGGGAAPASAVSCW